MSEETVAVVRRANEAFAAGDVETALSLLAPDIEWHGTVGGMDEGRVVYSRDEVVQGFLEYFENWERIELRAEEYFDAGGEEVVVFFHEVAKGRESGVVVETDNATISTVRDGVIVRVRAYMDRSEALRMAGLPAAERFVTSPDVENARTGYALMNEAYLRGDVELLRPHVERFCHPDVVFEPAGILPESTGTRRGVDGILDFMAEQMKAFADGDMRIEPLEYIEAGEWLVVPYRFGGRARYTGLEVAFEFVHVFSQHDGLTSRLEVYPDMRAALDALEARGYDPAEAAALRASSGSK